MKIYSSVDPETDAILSCIGKDVWLHCRITYTGREGYVRILTRPSGGCFLINWVPASAIDKYLAETSQEFLRDITSKLINISVSDLDVVDPIEIVPTEELFPAFEHNTNILQFIGKNVWVKARLGDRYKNHDYYIYPMADKFGVIYFAQISANFVDDHIALEDYECENVKRQIRITRPPMIISHANALHMDAITLCDPLEILTTEEIEEELEKCDVLDDGDGVYYE